MAEHEGISEISPIIKNYPLDPMNETNTFNEDEVKFLLNGTESSGTGSGSEDISGSATDLSGPEISATDYSSEENFDADFIDQT
jgi:hypothetical protein